MRLVEAVEYVSSHHGFILELNNYLYQGGAILLLRPGVKILSIVHPRHY